MLGIVGSPRRGGNTETLIDAILDGAAEADAEVDKVILDELDIRPCKGCFGCADTHHCVQDDDMKMITAKMQQSSIWVLGTPIYWWGPSAQFKAYLDRWVSISQTTFHGKHVILAIPMGGGSETYARHTLAMFEDIFNYLDLKHVGTILAPGSNGRDAVHNSPHVLEKAHRIGKETVKNAMKHPD
jgi:multimeric flavodoxin WrbA